MLNAVVAENEMPDRILTWRQNSPLSEISLIEGLSEGITCFSKREYNKDTVSSVFSFLDVHNELSRQGLHRRLFNENHYKASKQAWLAFAKQK